MADALNQAGSDTGARICTLRYCKRESLESGAGEVIFLVIKRGDKVTLYTRRELSQLVAHRDQIFIEELLADMIQRAQDSPDELFEHVYHLGVGPVITDSVRSFETRPNSPGALFPDYFPAEFRKSYPIAGDKRPEVDHRNQGPPGNRSRFSD